MSVESAFLRPLVLATVLLLASAAPLALGGKPGSGGGTSAEVFVGTGNLTFNVSKLTGPQPGVLLFDGDLVCIDGRATCVGPAGPPGDVGPIGAPGAQGEVGPAGPGVASAGAGLVYANGALSLDFDVVQARVNDWCGSAAIRQISNEGQVVCEPDDDLLSSISCTNGKTLKYTGGTARGWDCADDQDALASLSCATSAIAKRTTTGWACGTDLDTLGSLSCAPGEIAKWSSGWRCAPDLSPRIATSQFSAVGLTTSCSAILRLDIEVPGPGAILVQSDFHVRLSHNDGTWKRATFELSETPGACETVGATFLLFYDELFGEDRLHLTRPFYAAGEGARTFWLNAELSEGDHIDGGETVWGNAQAVYYPS